MKADADGLGRVGMMHLRLWLLACMGWCMVWTLPAQASWEAYQQAGEAAYNRGDYATARRMFLAAVREARHFGPQDPRLDISLHKLALLRVAGSAHSKAGVRTQRVTRRKSHFRKPGMGRRGHRRQPARPGLRQARPGRQQHASLSARPGERRQGTRTTVARPAHRARRPTLHRTRLARHVAPPRRHGKRRDALRVPHLQRETPRRQRSHTLQRPRTTHRHKTTGQRSLTRGRHA
jgi:hypothetical protein